MATKEVKIGDHTYRLFGETMYIHTPVEQLTEIMDLAVHWFNTRSLGWLLMHTTATAVDNDIVRCRFNEDLDSLNSALDHPLESMTLELDFELKHAYMSFYY